jgi:hypothetical protein
MGGKNEMDLYNNNFTDYFSLGEERGYDSFHSTHIRPWVVDSKPHTNAIISLFPYTQRTRMNTHTWAFLKKA